MRGPACKSLLIAWICLVAPAWSETPGPRDLMLNLPVAEVERLNQTLGTALTRERLVDLVGDRLRHDFGWTGLVFVGDSYPGGAELYVPSQQFFQLNGVFSFSELLLEGRRVGGFSSGHVGRVSIPEILRVAADKNLDSRQIEVLLCNMVIHEWIGHGVSDSSVFHGTPPMGPSIRGMLPAFAAEVMPFQVRNDADLQIYRKVRFNLACP